MDAAAFMHGAQYMPEHGYPIPRYQQQTRPASSNALLEHQKHPFFGQNNHALSCDIKPRLTKEQHDILEAEFQKQNKPNTVTKKGFAEALNVSLDKVNNWFQNRRAKSKQDAKKQAGALNLLAVQQQQQQQKHQEQQRQRQQQQREQHPASQPDFSSDTDPSPAFPSAEYLSMMQHCASNEQLHNTFQPTVHVQAAQNFTEQPQYPQTFSNDFSAYNLQPPANSHDLFNGPDDLNRRTLTQEQFDAFANGGGAIGQHMGQYDFLPSNFLPTSTDEANGVFHDLQTSNFKEESDMFSFNDSALSSHDSSVPSSISDLSNFTSPAEHRSISGPSSEWSDSRSGSLAGATQDEGFAGSQWNSGMTVATDFFPVADQKSVPQPIEQNNGGWAPNEDGARRDSEASLLAQHMNLVGIDPAGPPPGSQDMRFKSPAPQGNIAARRQRPRPAALGIASLRSQSYSSAQPLSPSHAAPPLTAPAAQQLRRIRSSNVVNSVAQGRVQKSSGPGSAQRSPMNWTFADSLNSPKALRHASSVSQSSGSLAPPTPMSPHEFPRPERPAVPQWPSSSSQASRQPSISESDQEHSDSSYVAHSASFSPPHTPMYHQTQFIQQRIGSTVITENTPPQSAPAGQTCFPMNIFMRSHSQAHVHGLPLNDSIAPDQHVAPAEHLDVSENYSHGVASDNYSHGVHSVPEVTSAYGNGVPVVGPNGQLVMATFPHVVPSMPENLKQAQLQSQQQGFGQFVAHDSPLSQTGAQYSKQAQQSELFVHEYAPPDDLKSATTPRRAADLAPKNYTFANHGPEHYERGKDAYFSSSPESSVRSITS